MASDTQPTPDTTWTYPIRSCRLCREDVVPTVTVSNPGLPAPFRSTTITYVSEDCGRLIKPCKCKGTQRYIHEGCLAELRAKSPVKNAYLKCDLCGFQYNTQRLLIHDILLSRVARGFLTIFIVIFLMFALGFVADPILNLYVDPVETVATQRYWTPVTVDNVSDDANDSWWIRHFMKGFVSIGVVGFLKAILLANPWQFWNLRHSGLLGGGARAGNTGRDRAVNISWIAVVIGVGSALYFFYKQVAKFSQSTLNKFANNVIEVQMDDDDDDLKVPTQTSTSTAQSSQATDTTDQSQPKDEPSNGPDAAASHDIESGAEEGGSLRKETEPLPLPPPVSRLSQLLRTSSTTSSGLSSDTISDTSSDPPMDTPPDTDTVSTGYRSAIHAAQAPGWSFKSVE